MDTVILATHRLSVYLVMDLDVLNAKKATSIHYQAGYVQIVNKKSLIVKIVSVLTNALNVLMISLK